MLLVVSERKRQLSELLVSHYRSSGWKVEQAVDGTVRAAGPGSATWIGLAVAAEDLADELPIPVVRDPLQEQEREDVRLVISRIDRPAQTVTCGEQPLLQFLLRDHGHIFVATTAVGRRLGIPAGYTGWV